MKSLRNTTHSPPKKYQESERTVDEAAKCRACHIPERKITLYLLNPAHPAGGSKASFFLKFGFTASNWTVLAEALLLHARHNEVVETQETQYGRRYVVDGQISAPEGSTLNVRSAWYIDHGSDAPRFVTAHPLPKL
jgi:hypothetical protein